MQRKKDWGRWFDNECKEAPMQRKEARMLSLQELGQSDFQRKFIE